MPDTPDNNTPEAASNKNKSVRYYDYINSDEWRIRARMIRKAAGNRCQLCNCNDKALHVHHRSYERLGDEHPGDLTVLCKDCHAQFHHKSADDTLTEEETKELQRRIDRRAALRLEHAAIAASRILFEEVDDTSKGGEYPEVWIRKTQRNARLIQALFARPELVVDPMPQKLARFNAALRIIKIIKATPIEKFEQRIEALKARAKEWREMESEGEA